MLTSGTPGAPDLLARWRWCQESTWAPILGPGSASQHAVMSVLAPDQQILLFVFWSLILFHIKSIHENILDMKYTPAVSNISSSGVIFFQSTSMFYKRVSILVLLFQILILAVTSKKLDIQEEVRTMQWNMIILIRLKYKYPIFAWGTEEQSTFKGICICWKKKCECIFRTRKQVKQALRRFLWAAQIVTRLQFRCTENQFTVQVYRKPVYSTGVQKTSLQYNCIGNQFIVQVYREECTGTDITH